MLKTLLAKLRERGKKYSSFSEIGKELTMESFSDILYDKPEKIESKFKDNNGEDAIFTSVEKYYLIPEIGEVIEVGDGEKFSTIADSRISYEEVKALVVSKIENTTGDSEIESHLSIIIYQ